ncbi:MAG: acylphosphatase [Bacillota bacterium]|nr:acylphosphatase [Bacillota bacterium]
MAAVKFVISGLVQGVGFRAAVSRCANSLGLSGYVRNNADGTVTAVAEGPEEKLTVFEMMVRNGCGSFARVDRVEKSPLEEASCGPAFQIR